MNVFVGNMATGLHDARAASGKVLHYGHFDAGPRAVRVAHPWFGRSRATGARLGTPSTPEG